ncbi:MAG: SURF1 family protein [Rhodanobacteraceae bacterium]
MIRFRRPSLFAVFLTLAGVAAFVALGIWQLRRAQEKETLLARFAQAAHAVVQPFAEVAAAPPQTIYPHVRVHGHYAAHRIYILDDRMNAGRLGVNVFVPFVPDQGNRELLVNLGFLPRQGADEVLPDLPPTPDKDTTLTGLYAPPPAPGLKLGGNPLTRESAWPKLLTFIDLRALAGDLHQALYPRVLLLDPDPASPYVREWTPDVMPPSRHRAYAFQWFTFALAALVIFFIMHRDKRAVPEQP